MSTSEAQSLQQSRQGRIPWNKGKLVGQKPPLNMKEVWRIRFHLQRIEGTRDLALFDLDIDSKLRGCDLVHLKDDDIVVGGRVLRNPLILRIVTDQGFAAGGLGGAGRLWRVRGRFRRLEWGIEQGGAS